MLPKCIASLDIPYLLIRLFILHITIGNNLSHESLLNTSLSAIAALYAFLKVRTCASTAFSFCVYGKLVTCCIPYILITFSVSPLKDGSESLYILFGTPWELMYRFSFFATSLLVLLFMG